MTIRCLAPISRLACDLLVAVSRGYDADEGLSLEFVDAHELFAARAARTGRRINYEREMLESLLVGEFQLAYVNKPLLIHWLQEGADITFFSELGWLDRNHRVMGLVVRRELWDKGDVRSIGDLRGRRFGGGISGVMSEALRDEALAEGGLTAKDVENVALQSYEQAGAALRDGEIDAAVIGEPYKTGLKLAGVAVDMQDPVIGGPLDPMLVAGYHWFGEHVFPSGAIACNREFADENPEALQAFLRMKLRTSGYVELHRREFLDVVARATGHPRDVLEHAGFHHYIPYVDLAINQAIADKMHQGGYSKHNIDVGDHICKVTPLL